MYNFLKKFSINVQFVYFTVQTEDIFLTSHRNCSHQTQFSRSFSYIVRAHHFHCNIFGQLIQNSSLCTMNLISQILTNLIREELNEYPNLFFVLCKRKKMKQVQEADELSVVHRQSRSREIFKKGKKNVCTIHFHPIHFNKMQR